jgi:hypothetical protein
MGDGALTNPYPDKNPHLVRLPASKCMSVTDDEAGMSKIVREVYIYLPDTNDDPDFLAYRAFLCPHWTHKLTESTSIDWSKFLDK